jgi:Antitoxin VbhA
MSSRNQTIPGSAGSDSTEERRESSIEIMASWALEGMTPTPEVRDRIRAYVNGEVTLDEAIAQAKERYATGK